LRFAATHSASPLASSAASFDDRDGPRAHLREQPLHVAFEGEGDAVADAAGPGNLDGLVGVPTSWKSGFIRS
jgi:hypothetical protein